MITNADLTIYNKYLVSSAEKYQRTVINDVRWENRKAVNGMKSGTLASNVAKVMIQFSQGVNYLKQKAWQALVTKTGKWTLQEGDVIVKGSVADEITSGFTITSLKAKYDDVLVITSVDTFDVGSPNMHHWEIGAK